MRVTASQLGYANTAAYSAATSAVQPGVISNTAAPTISGDPRVDSTLTAQPGSWSPGPVSLSYRWQADGQYLAGQTEPHSRPRSRPDRQGDQGRGDRRPGPATPPSRRSPRRPTRSHPARCGRPPPPALDGQPLPGTDLRLGSITGDPAASRQVRWSRDYAAVPGRDRGDVPAHLRRPRSPHPRGRLPRPPRLQADGGAHGVHPPSSGRPRSSGSRRPGGTSAWPSAPPCEPRGSRTSTASSRSAPPASSSARWRARRRRRGDRDGPAGRHEDLPVPARVHGQEHDQDRRTAHHDRQVGRPGLEPGTQGL